MTRIIVPVSKAKPDQDWENPSWPPRVPAGLHIPQASTRPGHTAWSIVWPALAFVSAYLALVWLVLWVAA